VSEREDHVVVRIGHVAGRVLDLLLQAAALLAGLMLAAGIGTVLMEVGARFLFGVSYPWVFEINENILVYVPFLAAAWVLHKGGHVTIDLLEAVLPQSVRHATDVGIAAVGAAACSVIVWFGTDLAWTAYRQGRVSLTVTQIPEVYVLSALPIGAALLVAEFVRQGIRASLGQPPVARPMPPEPVEATPQPEA
jgi:TRAP-type C4-dicarboxylate transport system permease small subunit